MSFGHPLLTFELILADLPPMLLMLAGLLLMPILTGALVGGRASNAGGRESKAGLEGGAASNFGLEGGAASNGGGVASNGGGVASNGGGVASNGGGAPPGVH